jgi:hypothetical protein
VPLDPCRSLDRPTTSRHQGSNLSLCLWRSLCLPKPQAPAPKTAAPPLPERQRPGSG